MRIIKVFLLTTLVLVFSGCGTTGKKFDMANCEKIELGKTTREEVRHLIGEPYSIMRNANGEELWTYKHSKYSYSLVDTYFALEGIDIDPRKAGRSQILIVTFDKDHVVTDFVSYEGEYSSEDAQAFPEVVQGQSDDSTESAEGLFDGGLLYGASDDNGRPLEYFERGVKENPASAKAHYNLGIAYGNLGRHQDAIETFKQAIRITPDYALAHFNLGVAYVKSGRNQEAIEAFKQVIGINPDDADAHYSLGIVCISNGDTGSALEQFKILKTLDPEKANKLFDLIYK